MKVISSFDFEYSFLSNFYICDVAYNKVIYKSSEHAYQAAKMITEEDHDFIASLKYPGQTKLKIRNLKKKENWTDIKYDIMRDILIEKFKNKELKQKLFKTIGYNLREGNNWHDNYWGDCGCKSCRRITGKNILGNILMEIRDEMKPKLF